MPRNRTTEHKTGERLARSPWQLAHDGLVQPHQSDIVLMQCVEHATARSVGMLYKKFQRRVTLDQLRRGVRWM